MGRKIRLTESQFRKMIAKIVKESRYEYDEELIEDEDSEDIDNDEMDPEEAKQVIADFFEEKVLPKLSSKEMNILKSKGSHHHKRRMDEEEDEMSDIDSRRANRREKGMIRGGLALSAVSAVAAISQFMGWSESETIAKIHDYVQEFGAGNYTGPITMAMVAAGLAIALKGADMRSRRTGK